MAPVADGSYGSVRADPVRTAVELQRGPVVGIRARVLSHSMVATTWALEFAPPPPFPHYPTEMVHLSVFADGQVVTVPVGPMRRWLHRYPQWSVTEFVSYRGDPIPWLFVCGGLCLWNPDDPSHLRWDWPLGLDAYVAIVQRHLWMEEFCREHHSPWPVEDTPHGRHPGGKPYPILTPSLRAA